MALNRIRFYEVKKIIAEYKKSVNKVVANHKIAMDKLKESKHIYSDSYYAERENALSKELQDYVGVYRKAIKQKIKPILDGMQLDVDSWVSEPVDSNFLQRINTIKTMGLDLGTYEAKALIDSSRGNYMSERLLYALAHPKQEESPIDVFAYYGDGYNQSQPVRKPQKEMPLEFMGMREPNVQDLVRDFEALKNKVGVILDYYSGTDMCSDLFKENSADAAPYMSAAQNDYSAEIDGIASKWADTMLKSGQKLSDGEKQWIDSNFQSCKSVFDKKSTANKMMSDVPGIKNLLEVSEYAGYLE